ncbi:MAG TPA: hypothetical protein VHD56_06780 [Tepidisphaeraceae bacterium]|nr:hypothetical protein [Tepidisphaeraceae bacterium]
MSEITQPPRMRQGASRVGEIRAGQTEVAVELYTNQGQISRWVNEVAAWIEAGNVLPGLDGLASKPVSIDPDVIEMGQRQDRRTGRQRGKSDDDEQT